MKYLFILLCLMGCSNMNTIHQDDLVMFNSNGDFHGVCIGKAQHYIVNDYNEWYYEVNAITCEYGYYMNENIAVSKRNNVRKLK